MILFYLPSLVECLQMVVGQIWQPVDLVFGGKMRNRNVKTETLRTVVKRIILLPHSFSTKEGLNFTWLLVSRTCRKRINLKTGNRIKEPSPDPWLRRLGLQRLALGSNHFKQVLIVIATADYNLFFFFFRWNKWSSYT